jgi:hypothetical protein
MRSSLVWDVRVDWQLATDISGQPAGSRRKAKNSKTMQSFEIKMILWIP